MTGIKIVGKPYAQAQGSLDAHADWLYAHPGGRVIGVIELVHRAATQPAPEVEKDRVVELGISMLELASADQEDTMRRACRALHLQRTAVGTLDPDGEVEMSERVLAETVSDLSLAEMLRLRIGIRAWADKAKEAFSTPNIQGHELAHELEAVHAGLVQLLAGTKPE